MRGRQKMMDREHDEGGLKLLTRLINGALPGVKLWPAQLPLTQYGVSFRPADLTCISSCTLKTPLVAFMRLLMQIDSPHSLTSSSGVENRGLHSSVPRTSTPIIKWSRCALPDGAPIDFELFFVLDAILCAVLITECMGEAKWVGGLESCALLSLGKKRRRMDASSWASRRA